MKAILTLLLTVLLISSIQAEVIYVPDDYFFINEAIDHARDGDIILVARGVYEENIDFEGKQIILASMMFETDDPEDMEETILDGMGEAATVSFVNREPQGTILYGFTIRNGSGIQGGGIAVRGATVALMNLIIEENEAYHGGGLTGTGGGIYFNGGNISLSDAIIRDNVGIYGAGIVGENGTISMVNVEVYNNHGTGIPPNSPTRGGATMFITCNITMNNCIVADNIADGPGAGMFLHVSSQAVINNSIFVNNVSIGNYYGGVISANSSSVARLYNCLVYGNEAAIGAVFHGFAGIIDVVNCTVVGNIATGEDGGAAGYITSGSTMTSVNSIFWDNGDDQFFMLTGDINRFGVDHSCLENGEDAIAVNNSGEYLYGENNLDENPLFNRDFDGEEDDFTLYEVSPCIDAGTDFWSYRGREIVNLNDNQYLGDAPDMGCFEFEPDDAVRESIHPEVVSNFKFESLYPNPFNDKTRLDFSLSQSGNVKIELVDLRGRAVAEIINGQTEAGKQSIALNLQGRASGVYFVKVNVNGLAIGKYPIVLMK